MVLSPQSRSLIQNGIKVRIEPKAPTPCSPISAICDGIHHVANALFFIYLSRMTKLRFLCSTTLVFASFCGMASAESDVSPSLDRGEFSPFIRSLNVKPYGYTLISDPTGMAPAKQVERFEVRSGDCHFNGGWSDCERNRERSELWEQGDRSPRGTSAWYGWSFFVPEDWPNVEPAKTVIGQFHQHRAHPIWMFLNHKGGLVLDDQSTGRSTRSIPLIDEANFTGRWHRIEVNGKWETDNTGFLKVWVNGELKLDYSGQTMTADTVYFRFGVYRSFISRYKTKIGSELLPTQIAMFAKVRKAATREGLN